MRSSELSPSTESSSKSKRFGTLAIAGIKVLQAKDLPKDQVTVQPFKEWHPPRMKTGLRNQPIGRKVAIIALPGKRNRA
jgi:hypothetical protein